MTQSVSQCSVVSLCCLAKRKNRQREKTHTHDVYMCVCLCFLVSLLFSNMKRTRYSGRVCVCKELCFALCVCVCVCSSPSAVYVMANGDCSSKMYGENALVKQKCEQHNRAPYDALYIIVCMCVQGRRKRGVRW